MIDTGFTVGTLNEAIKAHSGKDSMRVIVKYGSRDAKLALAIIEVTSEDSDQGPGDIVIIVS
jgi:hypothetical protein